MERTFHKIEIRPSSAYTPGHPSTGANTEILLDGLPIRGATSIRYSCEADGVARVEIGLVAVVGISGHFELENRLLETPVPPPPAAT